MITKSLLPPLLAAVLFHATGVQSADYVNGIGMEFKKIDSGCFQMGRDPDAEQGGDNELPRHKVCITKPFYIGKTEVTQDQWTKIMGYNKSKFKGGDRPVERVSGETVFTFIGLLNKKEKGAKYRLPTEAEWEYVARAGSETTYFFGNDPGELSEYAWFGGEQAENQTHPVAGKKPNPWGVYDIYGNVWELVRDYYKADYYADSPTDDPRYAKMGDYQVVRGCDWSNGAAVCRSAQRGRVHRRMMDEGLGFRLVLENLPAGE